MPAKPKPRPRAKAAAAHCTDAADFSPQAQPPKAKPPRKR
jgi:hypothetical protein